ncbi:MAG: KpsF/GutQ family sugar-phosphate isomerase [candidate division Zixibacteria bacterium]|nr:KpsF/GutQ family sugar-phosphate isomerase [candidate division Zixibacteria bacterium]
MDVRQFAKEVMRSEAAAIEAMASRLDEQFNAAVDLIQTCAGRIILTGMGKSGLIARKIAATFNSTGISSIFLHPAEALHGDLGLIRPEDILIIVSKSGRMGELDPIIAASRRLQVKIIVLGGTIDSPLFQRADIGLDCSVANEACPNNLVPTSSSTAALVMGDALAIALVRARNFTPEDFAGLHPGGAIGMRLLKHVSELHHSGDQMPLVCPKATMSEMVVEMTGKRLGCVLMKNDNGTTGGIFTDGDLRRLVELKKDVFSMTAEEVMIKNPKSVWEGALLDTALAMMEKYTITQLPTVDSNRQLVGVIHLHDILKSKLV